VAKYDQDKSKDNPKHKEIYVLNINLNLCNLMNLTIILLIVDKEIYKICRIEYS